MKRIFDRREHFDERSRDYPIRTMSWLLMVAALSVCLLSGCASIIPTPRLYTVQGFDLVLMAQRDIQFQYRMKYGIDLAYIGGYCDQDSRIIYCQYDKFVAGQPDFFALGHEVYHLYELGGNFHK